MKKTALTFEKNARSVFQNLQQHKMSKDKTFKWTLQTKRLNGHYK